jgi:hypothetical protein
MPNRTGSLEVACLLVMLLGCSSSPSLHAQDMTLPATISFDDSLHRFYAYGHRIRSPAILTYEDGQLVVNGFRPAPVVLDTTGREASAAKIYKDVPYIQRLHKNGATYEQASREYSRAVCARMPLARSSTCSTLLGSYERPVTTSTR